MSRSASLIALPAIAILISACGIDLIGGVRGSGDVVTESREVSGFDEIVVQGSGEVTLEVTGTESLVIEAEDNIMPLLTSEVVNGRLELGASESISPTEPIRYTITAAELDGVTIEGSGSVLGTDIDSDRFRIDIDGSGSVNVHGSAEFTDVQIDGSGSVDAAGLRASTAEVTINGSGGVVVNAADSLTVTINGSGGVVYLGSPDVDQTINGSGSVTRR